MIKEVTTQRRMPPWHADPRYGHFTNDRRLTREEIDTLTAWVDGGMARGDDKDLPKPIDWPKGWVHGKPDLVFTMPEEFEVPADGVLPYKNWIIDTEIHGRQVGADRRGPARARRAWSITSSSTSCKEGQRGPVDARRQPVDPGRLGAGRPGSGLPAGHGPARPQGGQAAVRDALHAQRQGGEGPLVDRHHLRQEAAEVRDAS